MCFRLCFYCHREPNRHRTALLGKADDVERPTLVSPLPNDKGGLTFLTDCGANVDCSPTQLLQFAKCAVNYAKSQGISSPKVGLLSVGKEDKKGNALTKETFLLLKDSDLSFVGNMEANAALSGEVHSLRSSRSVGFKNRFL